MADLIERQAAIDAIEPTLKSILQGNSFKAINVMDKIRELPSAQSEIVMCKDCKHWEYDVIFADGWCRGKQQGNPEWYCADAERRTDE